MLGCVASVANAFLLLERETWEGKERAGTRVSDDKWVRCRVRCEKQGDNRTTFSLTLLLSAGHMVPTEHLSVSCLGHTKQEKWDKSKETCGGCNRSLPHHWHGPYSKLTQTIPPTPNPQPPTPNPHLPLTHPPRGLPSFFFHTWAIPLRRSRRCLPTKTRSHSHRQRPQAPVCQTRSLLPLPGRPSRHSSAARSAWPTLCSPWTCCA